MSSEDTSEKKHKPSQKRIDQQKKDGQFLRAKEFYSGLTLIAAMSVLYALSGQIYSTLSNNFLLTYSKLDVLIRDEHASKVLFQQLWKNNLLAMLPVFAVILVALLSSVGLMGGIHFSRKLLSFKGERLSPYKNLKRIFSLQNAMEVAKSVLKLFLFMIILVIFLQSHQEEIRHLSIIGEVNMVGKAMHLLALFLGHLALGILILAAIDGVFNYHQFQKKAKMTDKDLRDESKDTDGNPEVKKKQKQAQFALALQRLQQDIPKASVIITNPTHYAVALKYQDKVDSAPKIVAKGADHMALHIRTLAKKHSIPIYEAPELARAIFHTGKVGHHILPELYIAVAIVLSYLFQLRNYQAGRGSMPEPISDLKIPDELKY